MQKIKFSVSPPRVTVFHRWNSFSPKRALVPGVGKFRDNVPPPQNQVLPSPGMTAITTVITHTCQRQVLERRSTWTPVAGWLAGRPSTFHVRQFPPTFSVLCARGGGGFSLEFFLAKLSPAGVGTRTKINSTFLCKKKCRNMLASFFFCRFALTWPHVLEHYVYDFIVLFAPSVIEAIVVRRWALWHRLPVLLVIGTVLLLYVSLSVEGRWREWFKNAGVLETIICLTQSRLFFFKFIQFKWEISFFEITLKIIQLNLRYRILKWRLNPHTFL